MEYSMEMFSNGLLQCTVSQSIYPHLSNFPATEDVNPGIGQMVNMYHTFVPVPGKPLHVLEKKYEDHELKSTIEQSGEGKVEETVDGEFELNKNDASLDPKIKDSLDHPKMIETEKVFLSKTKVHKRKNVSQDGGAQKPKKYKHSFVFSNA